MASYFYLEKVRKSGLSPIFIRVQDFRLKVDIRQFTKLLIADKVFNAPKGSKEYRTYCKDENIKKIFDSLEDIRKIIDEQLDAGHAVNKDEVRVIISEVVYKQEREAAKAAAEEKARQEAWENRMTLMKFIDKYIELSLIHI